ncbi:MAG: ATP phosphoribosyltransferase regulatory subunit [Kofleriaceae bacterium]
MTTSPPIRLPSGVRDFLPRAAARRRDLAERVMDVFESWGYARLITPMFECADVLERGLGAGAKAAAIRFVEPGTGEIVALRPDITPQIARVVATRMADVPGPIRLCYEGAVSRLTGDRGQREILQAGIELVDDHDAGDAEVLAVATAVLERLGLEVHLDVGHVAPARHVLDAAPDPAARAALVAAIARKDRAGVRVAARALPDAVASLAGELVQLWGPAAATLARARALAWPEPVHAAFTEIEHTLATLEHLVGARDRPIAVSIDFGDLRGFDYYTGMRFAGYATGAPDAILRGGRYDELIGRYGRPARATGFAIDLEAVAEAQRGAGIALPVAALGVATPDPVLANQLRAAGVRAVVQNAVVPAWLRGAGLDAAITGDRIAFADDRVVTADHAIQAARAGDTASLIALLKG